jgi:hypothetical protein
MPGGSFSLAGVASFGNFPNDESRPKAAFVSTGLMPTERPSLQERVRFGIDYTFFLNLAFGAAAAWLFYLHFSDGQGQRRQQEHCGQPARDRV